MKNPKQQKLGGDRMEPISESWLNSWLDDLGSEVRALRDEISRNELTYWEAKESIKSLSSHIQEVLENWQE